MSVDDIARIKEELGRHPMFNYPTFVEADQPPAKFVDDLALQEMAAQCQLQTWNAGGPDEDRFVLRQGETADCMYLVVSGTFVTEGVERPTDFATGTIFGAHPMFVDDRDVVQRAATIKVWTTGQLVMIPYTALQNLKTRLIWYFGPKMANILAGPVDEVIEDETIKGETTLAEKTWDTGFDIVEDGDGEGEGDKPKE